MELTIKFKKLRSTTILPHYSRKGDAAMDIYSCEDKTLVPGETYKFSTGFATEFPEDYVCLIYRRSGMAAKPVVPIGVGVIDSNYRGEWFIPVINLSKESYEIKTGDRIAQIIFHKIDKFVVKEVDELSESNRGQEGFGSSGR